MDYKGLHYAGIAFDILYCIWFVLMLLLNCFAEGLSGMDHSSDSVLHAYERQCNFISYSAGLIGNIIGFFMLLNMSVYYYYQLIVKCIVMALFLIFFAICCNSIILSLSILSILLSLLLFFILN